MIADGHLTGPKQLIDKLRVGDLAVKSTTVEQPVHSENHFLSELNCYITTHEEVRREFTVANAAWRSGRRDPYGATDCLGVMVSHLVCNKYRDIEKT